MRILILANNDVGLYQFRKELIAELLKKNKVYISLPYGELVDKLVDMGCRFIDTPIDRRGINPITDLKLFIAYDKIIKKLKPQLVITYTIKPNIYGGMVCRLRHTQYAINITGLGTAFENGGILRKTVVFLDKIAFKKAKVVFFENESNRQLFIKENIVKRDQTYKLNGAGVNLDHYKICDYPKGDVTKFLFMGRVMAEKGINELLAAMKKLIIDGYNVHLDILGSYEEDYKEMLVKCEQEGWLTYHGYQSDVRPFIMACHCFVLPSWHEGMANTNLECAASGRPVITSDIPGCKEAIIDGETGFLSERKDADSLYIAMKKIVELGYDERRLMGILGNKHMRQYFDKNIVVMNTVSQIT